MFGISLGPLLIGAGISLAMIFLVIIPVAILADEAQAEEEMENWS